MKRLSLLLLLIPTLLQAAGDPRWYQVEVIIYAHNNTDYHESELWPVDYSLPKLEGSQELVAAPSRKVSTSKPVPFSLLRSDALQLGGAASRIKRASDVDLLLHFGWLQPGLEEKKAVAVHIHDKMLESAAKAKASAKESKELPKLDGTLRLVLSRYLHLESDLIWRDPMSAEELALLSALPVQKEGETETETVENEEGIKNGETVEENNAVATELAAEPVAVETAPQLPLITHHVYRMQQSRRMRSNELHYIDHPRFGIVAIATRYEPNKTAKPAAAN